MRTKVKDMLTRPQLSLQSFRLKISFSCVYSHEPAQGGVFNYESRLLYSVHEPDSAALIASSVVAFCPFLLCLSSNAARPFSIRPMISAAFTCL